MNAWHAAAAVLLLALVPCAVVILRGTMGAGIAALQAAGTITGLVLLLMAQALGRPSTADVALTLALLSFPSGLLFAFFRERWL